MYGVRVKREATLFLRVAYKAFYRVFRRRRTCRAARRRRLLAHRPAGDERAQRAAGEQPLPARPARLGRIPADGVPYVRPERMFGRTTNSLVRNLGWARQGDLLVLVRAARAHHRGSRWSSSSSRAFVAHRRRSSLRHRRPASTPRGLTTVIVVVLFLGGIQLLCLSIIGSYLAHIYDEVKRRPPFIVESVLNAPPEHRHGSDRLAEPARRSDPLRLGRPRTRDAATQCRHRGTLAMGESGCSIFFVLPRDGARAERHRSANA